MPAPQYTRSWAGGEALPNSTRPRFFMQAIKDELATAKEGRPIYVEIEMIERFMPSVAQWTIPVNKVTDADRAEFPRQYEAFKQGLEIATEGTPIESWSRLDRAMVEELKAIGLRTVEEIATLDDRGIQRVMGLPKLRLMARAYLDEAAASALSEALIKENDELKVDVARLNKQVEELGVITQRMHGELLGLKNQPNTIAGVAPMHLDPAEAMRMQQANVQEPRAATSSLAAFAEEQEQRGKRSAANG
jgi:hypothetical protein